MTEIDDASLHAGGKAELGVIGTGRMGIRLAAMFARAGRRVLLASRTPGRARQVTEALRIPGLLAGSHGDAFAAPAVLPALFLRDGLAELLEAHAGQLDGTLVIDISNPFNEDYSDYILPWDTSSAEVVQALLPRSRIVGAFKHVFSAVFDAPLFDGSTSDVLVVGDDDQAKARFLALAEGTPFRYLDAGPLRFARTLERLTLITGRVGRQSGYYPRMNWRLLGDAARVPRPGPMDGLVPS
jgi:8-hydroxy-5-deazaflavin:NADPH oxidoreductase